MIAASTTNNTDKLSKESASIMLDGDYGTMEYRQVVEQWQVVNGLVGVIRSNPPTLLLTTGWGETDHPSVTTIRVNANAVTSTIFEGPMFVLLLCVTRSNNFQTKTATRQNKDSFSHEHS